MRATSHPFRRRKHEPTIKERQAKAADDKIAEMIKKVMQNENK